MSPRQSNNEISLEKFIYIQDLFICDVPVSRVCLSNTFKIFSIHKHAGWKNGLFQRKLKVGGSVLITGLGTSGKPLNTDRVLRDGRTLRVP